ncbi:MAG: hypothetical protein AN484_00870 [Aphanizomenon flos-aquae WA102]|jgi:hypothetical protein|uniref:Uncharacterized protein n=1 Tax=Aphanizomenon flos-aquae WA102 TaxID=1710896 RepID=A0A1B7X8A1_APHFL|nr:MAG: hypothetical protein AN484_00870 [Aphanizomenon flos-aquae WA102]
MNESPVDKLLKGDYSDWFVTIDGQKVPSGFGVTNEEMLKIKEYFGDNVVIFNESMSKEEVEKQIKKVEDFRLSGNE